MAISKQTPRALKQVNPHYKNDTEFWHNDFADIELHSDDLFALRGLTALEDPGLNPMYTDVQLRNVNNHLQREVTVRVKEFWAAVFFLACPVLPFIFTGHWNPFQYVLFAFRQRTGTVHSNRDLVGEQAIHWLRTLPIVGKTLKCLRMDHAASKLMGLVDDIQRRTIWGTLLRLIRHGSETFSKRSI